MVKKDSYPWSLAKPVVFDGILILTLFSIFLAQISSYLLGSNEKADIAGAIAASLAGLLKYRHDSFFSKNQCQIDLISGCFEGIDNLMRLARIRSYFASKAPLILLIIGAFALINRVFPINQAQ